MPLTPSPGAYEKKTTFEEAVLKEKGFIFGVGRKEMEITGLTPKNKNPGPGSYQSFNPRKNLAFSIQGKSKIVDKELILVPGPGKCMYLKIQMKTLQLLIEKTLFLNISIRKEENLKIARN